MINTSLDKKKIVLFFIFLTFLLGTLISCSGKKEIIKEDTKKIDEKIETEVKVDSLALAVEEEDNKDIEIQPILNRANFDEAFPSISPDGNYIIYQGRKVGEDWDIYLFNVEDDSSTIFYSSAGDDESPKFSKDGSMVVFTSDKDGFEYEDGKKSRDIYLVKLNNQKNLVKITESEGDNWFPNFYYNDKRILFSSNVNDSEQNYYSEKVSLFSYDLKTKAIIEKLAYIDYKNLAVYSHDLQKVAFTDNESKLKIINILNKDNVLLVSDDESYSSASFFNEDGSKLFYQNYKDLSYTINVYDIAKDVSSIIVDHYNNSRGPVLYNNNLYFHSNKGGKDYNIYMKVLSE